MSINQALIDQSQKLIDLALSEDLSNNIDLSTDAIFTIERTTAQVTSKSDQILFGLFIVDLILSRFTDDYVLETLVAEGEFVKSGTVLFRIRAETKVILRCERVVLNFLGFLSGIATRTKLFADIAKKHGNTKILDTRKTLPGYRALSKAAVLAGGGVNHRMGLYDMVMLKDNHIDCKGSITKAYEEVLREYGTQYKIEVECRNLVEVEEALKLGVGYIMLDNMSLEVCKKAVALRKSLNKEEISFFEASGDMTPERVEAYSQIGLDFISIGQITHSVTNANLSMTIEASS